MAWYCIVAKCASEVRDHWEIGEGMGFAFAFPIAFADWFCDYDVGMGENTTYCCHIFTTKLGSAKPCIRSFKNDPLCATTFHHRGPAS